VNALRRLAKIAEAARHEILLASPISILLPANDLTLTTLAFGVIPCRSRVAPLTGLLAPRMGAVK
jgi:hypothetical protein